MFSCICECERFAVQGKGKRKSNKKMASGDGIDSIEIESVFSTHKTAGISSGTNKTSSEDDGKLKYFKVFI